MDIDVYIFGDRTAFQTSSSSRVFWSPGGDDGEPAEYTGPVPNTGRRIRWLSKPPCAFFPFNRTNLNGEHLMMLAYFRAAPPRGKSNVLGVELGGPFSWMARLLKSAGAKESYGVHSPKVLFKWTARDLARYCHELALAIQKKAETGAGASGD
ncbi:hypothetical protein [Gemmata sp.]|uniref:hypothetical protein n=1 Tax=Gemmata sp. TaxID=1914242 RepID=UPI003F72569C